jgi:hypothetical protein
MKVEYTVGAFLAELDIVTHMIPDVPKNNLTPEVRIKNMKNASVRIQRKTENTTKKKFKSLDNQ